MIRFKTQCNAARRSLSQLELDCQHLVNQPASAEVLAQLHALSASVRRLEALVQEYEWLKNSEVKKDVIPTWQLHSGNFQLSDAAFMVRDVAKLSQDEMADKMETHQNQISRIEGSETENCEIQTMRRWAQKCGYELLMTFVRKAQQNDPSTIARLGMETAAIKYFFGNSDSECLKNAFRLFLSRLYEVTSADIATCYIIDERRNCLELFHHLGVFDTEKMEGRVKETDLPMRLLRSKSSADFVVDTSSSPDFRSSPFVVREGVRSVFYLPFDAAIKGILFLSYRTQIATPSPEYLTALRNLGELVSFLLGSRPSLPFDLSHNRSAAPLRFRRPDNFLSASDWATRWVETLIEAAEVQLGLPKVRIMLYWHDGNELKPDPTLRGSVVGTCSSESKNVARVAHEGGPFVLEQGKLLGVPITSGERRTGALVAHDTGGCALGAEHSEVLEVVGQAIARIKDFDDVVRRRLPDLFLQTKNARAWMQSKRFLRYRQLITELCFGEASESGVVATRLSSLAELAVHAFKASIVDIWPFDLQHKVFLVDAGANSIATTWRRRFDRADLAPRPNGNSIRIVREIQRPLLIADAREDQTVSPATVRLGLRSLLGVPMFGPKATYASGCMWIRFDRRIPKSQHESLIADAKVVAAFADLISDPLACTTFIDTWSKDNELHQNRHTSSSGPEKSELSRN